MPNRRQLERVGRGEEVALGGQSLRVFREGKTLRPAMTDSQSQSARSSNKRLWARNEVFELISLYENSPMLWDIRCKDFHSRLLKTNALENIALHFDTTVDQVLKKVHNLRSQLAQELKKQATRKSKDGYSAGYVSKWPYFKVLSFLTPEQMHPTPCTSASLTIQSICDATSIPVHILAQPVDVDPIMLDSSMDMRPADSYEPSMEDQSNSEEPTMHNSESRKRSADSDPTTEEVLLKAIKVLTDPEDEFQVFGRYIASELRGLYSNDSRRQLKRAIQRAVLEAYEMDDIVRLNSQPNDPLATNH